MSTSNVSDANTIPLCFAREHEQLTINSCKKLLQSCCLTVTTAKPGLLTDQQDLASCLLACIRAEVALDGGVFKLLAGD